ncbi:hypothetical protein [Alloyangia pacifica]|uniref:hypothetical protein n=1 Tax=Alloyangia pacifica TaxID=311180 RepID=UPI001CFC97D3|nr:hypothetical protein [Alloyangia pacifica]
MRERSLGKTIKTLLLALLNATLILVALCLFLALQLSKRVEQVTDSFARNIVTIDPLRQEIATMTAEVSGLRADLGSLREGGSDMTTEAAQRITARLDTLDTRLDAASQRIERLLDSPEDLVDRAVERAAEELRLGIHDFRNCVPNAEVSAANAKIMLPPEAATSPHSSG